MRRIILVIVAALAFCGSLQADDNPHPYDLEVGSAYVVSRRTAVMPEVEPADPMAALEKVKRIPVGGAFKILGIRMKDETPWYKVCAITADKKHIGIGFISGVALLGQTLTPFAMESSQAASPKEPRKPTEGSYSIASFRDVDYGDPDTMRRIRRREYRVHLTRELTEPELKAIAEEVIAQAPPLDAILVFLYLPDSQPTGGYTAGRATSTHPTGNGETPLFPQRRNSLWITEESSVLSQRRCWLVFLCRRNRLFF